MIIRDPALPSPTALSGPPPVRTIPDLAAPACCPNADRIEHSLTLHGTAVVFGTRVQLCSPLAMALRGTCRWRSFLGAIAAVVCFQLLADEGLVSAVPATQLAWNRHVGWEHLAFASLGLLEGLLSAFVVACMSALAKFVKRRGLLQPPCPRFATGLLVCAVITATRFLVPLTRREALNQLAQLFADAGLDQRDTHGLTRESTTSHDHWRFWCGKATADDLHAECSPVLTLSLFSVVMLGLHLCSIVLPLPSGCFMPLFILGASTGRLYGSLLRSVFGYDSATLPDALMAIVGAGALAGGTTHTLSTALLTVELTDQQELITPVLIGVIVACGVSSLFSKSIYDQIMVLKVCRTACSAPARSLHYGRGESVDRVGQRASWNVRDGYMGATL